MGRTSGLTGDDVYAILHNKVGLGDGSGASGQDGVGISSIVKTGTEGLVDTYTITLTNNSTYTFTVTNGEDGAPGATGATPNIQIGTVQTLDSDSGATASITGTAENPLLNLGIPKGEKGDPGESNVDEEKIQEAVEDYLTENPIQEVTIDSTLTQSGQAADAKETGDALSGKVNNSGWTANKYLGTDESGDVVEKDAPASSGDGGTVSVEVESTTTGEPGTSASVTNTGDTQNVKLAFVIPRGETGPTGSQGIQGETGITPNITATATVDEYVGTPSVEVTKSGTDEAPEFSFAFHNLKGEKGESGDGASSNGLPSGGTTGQMLTKNSDADYDATWTDAPTGGDTVEVDAELKEYMNVAKPNIASAIINKGGTVESDDSLNDYATRISEIPNEVYPAETLPAQTTLTATGLQDSVGIKLNWIDVDASGYLILRKENAKPETSADGTIVYNGTYATEGYTDGDVSKGNVYYYRIFPRNSKNQYQSVEDGSVAMVDYKDRTGSVAVGDLSVGDTIKFGQWNSTDFFWKIVDTQDKNSGYVTVCAEQNLGTRQFDAVEPNNTVSARQSGGNNRWAYSAVRQLLNSEGDSGEWWVSQHEYDAEPSYNSSITGFLKDFTDYEKNVVITKTNKCVLDTNDGGGSETVNDKFWLASSYAVGLEIFQPLEDEHVYETFTDSTSRSYTSNWWLRTINGTSSASGVRYVGSSGSLYNNSASTINLAVRPFCLLSTSAYTLWSDSDNAYIFADDSQRNPSA